MSPRSGYSRVHHPLSGPIQPPVTDQTLCRVPVSYGLIALTCKVCSLKTKFRIPNGNHRRLEHFFRVFLDQYTCDCGHVHYNRNAQENPWVHEIHLLNDHPCDGCICTFFTPIMLCWSCGTRKTHQDFLLKGPRRDQYGYGVDGSWLAAWEAMAWELAPWVWNPYGDPMMNVYKRSWECTMVSSTLVADPEDEKERIEWERSADMEEFHRLGKEEE